MIRDTSIIGTVGAKTNNWSGLAEELQEVTGNQRSGES